MRKILFFTGLGALGLGAYLFYKRQLDILYDFKYSINDIKILERTADKITLQITISVRNESELDFYIKGYDLNVLINNEVVSNVKNSNMKDIYDTYKYIYILCIKEGIKFDTNLLNIIEKG